MLVFGDVERTERPAVRRAEIVEAMNACFRMPAGLRRHEALVRAFIATSELVQGVADREFADNGADDLSAAQLAGAELLRAQANLLMLSWRKGFAGELSLSVDWPSLLQKLDAPEPVRMKRAEGYGFYALYPESYVEAALRSGLTSKTIVIGLRSIGVGLGALVAAALRAGPAFSLRPAGHPFDRRLQVSAALSETILADPDADFAIVDEGPGLSGSSFGSVADWLQANGVSEGRIHFFPSHAGEPGPHSSDAHRALWKARPRHLIDMDELLLKAAEPAHQLTHWVGDLVGAPVDRFRDISGGAWRTLRHVDGKWKPPSHMQMEKRKFLMQVGDETWLAKFAGLGVSSREKERRATVLHEAGFTPEVAGTCHGFLVERWIEGTPLQYAELDESRIVEHLGKYLGFRAANLPAASGGASLDELCHMALVNTGEVLGQETAERLRRIFVSSRRSQRRLRRADTDNRLHLWEWIVAPDGRLVKTDALDHNTAHDLIGCQDIAWDVAGACVEFGLSALQRERLAAIVGEKAGFDLGEDVLRVFEACYLAFQIGLWSGARAGVDDVEKTRTDALLRPYTRRLKHLIAGSDESGQASTLRRGLVAAASKVSDRRSDQLD